MSTVTKPKRGNGMAQNQQENSGMAEVEQTERPFVSPEVNIYETHEGYVLQAEMPGVPKDGIDVTVEGNTITFVGRRADRNPQGSVVYRESHGADYRRVFELDPAVDTTRISAEMNQGVLVVSLPKAERLKPRRIEIN